jgi:hypothetical protein
VAAATGAAANLGQQPQFAASAAAVSRYRSDFQEMNRLGQGGFGVVVAAVNRQVASWFAATAAVWSACCMAWACCICGLS